MEPIEDGLFTGSNPLGASECNSANYCWHSYHFSIEVWCYHFNKSNLEIQDGAVFIVFSVKNDVNGMKKSLKCVIYDLWYCPLNKLMEYVSLNIKNHKDGQMESSALSIQILTMVSWHVSILSLWNWFQNIKILFYRIL